jgi:hypothetical protein
MSDRTRIDTVKARRISHPCHSREGPALDLIGGGTPLASRTILDPRLRRGDIVRLALTVVVSLIGGCEHPSTVTQPATETAIVADSEPVSRVEEPLLLLDDEPEDGESGEPAADNSRCFVCHVNYMDEEIAVTHASRNIGCAHCHGTSDEHIADESWASGGNGTAPDVMFPKDKINPACMACHTKEKIDTPEHAVIFAGPPDAKVCTDCHGNHRLPQRRCTWK